MSKQLPNVVVMWWVGEEDYLTLRDVLEDGYQLPPLYETWLNLAQKAENRAKGDGTVVRRIYIDANTLYPWCIQFGHRVDREACEKLAVHVATQREGSDR